MKKIISLVVIFCFFISNVSFAINLPLDNTSNNNGTNLAVPSLLKNILDKTGAINEAENIKLWLAACLRSIAAEGFDFKTATPEEIRDRLKELGEPRNAEIFHPKETQFFVHEATIEGDRVRVTARVKRDNSLRTYNITFSGPETIYVNLKRDSKDSIPSKGIFEDMESLVEFLRGIVEFDVKGTVKLIEGEEDAFIERLPVLVYNISVNPEDSIRDAIEWMILELGPQLPVNSAIPASTQKLYRTIGREYYKKSAILKINQRALIPYLYRIMLKVMREHNVAMISQIAISEAIYIVGGDAKKSPAINIAQAILAGRTSREGATPVFNSRDHLQVDKKLYDKNSAMALRNRADTIREDILEDKIYSVDLDTSTIARTPDEMPGSVAEQQRPNFETAVKYTIFVRLLEKIYGLPGIALNGEVGEVGTEEVTPEELRAYLTGYKLTLGKFMNFSPKQKLEWIENNNYIFWFSEEEMAKIKEIVQDKAMHFDGLEAMSCQVGTAHGGVKVPGRPWERTSERVVNMERLEELADICRSFGLAGLILHGASSISEDELKEAVERGAIAVHLATYIHDRIFSHPEFPTKLISKLFKLIKERNKKLYDTPIDKHTQHITIGDIIQEIQGTIEIEKPLSEEQRQQVAWIVHQARGKGVSKEQHDKGEGLWSFIDLEQDMLDLPKETLAELNKVVEEQILRYVELLNAKGTGDIIKDMEFPTPPPAPMPEPLKDHIADPPDAEPSSEINKMKTTATRVGLEIPTHLNTRYTLLLATEFFADSKEFKKHETEFRDRFNLGTVGGRTAEQFIDNVLAKARGIEHRTVVLLPDRISRRWLERLTAVGIRFIRTDVEDLVEARVNKDVNRTTFQLNTYATMLLIRHIDRSIGRESPLYRILSFYIKSHFKLDSNVEIEDYIQAIITGNIAILIRGYLSYRPAKPYQAPDYEKIAAALISA
ncbi:MAG: class II fructose-bisphosphate aldolase [Candidatus Omnitrophota bacterium]|nr:MAG: class II fructose-bisphosphate aldolase [Candidatus Omnitrophota bacterium]